MTLNGLHAFVFGARDKENEWRQTRTSGNENV